MQLYYPLIGNECKKIIEIKKRINFLTTINGNNLYSEFAVINFLHLSKEISKIVNEDVYLTVNGRMSTGSFDFFVKRYDKNSYIEIKVCNSQCEIDCGFETKNYFVIAEVKNNIQNDFLVRQLYYPYRLWMQKIKKKVIPILVIHNSKNSTINIFVYEFTRLKYYNSIQIKNQIEYRLI